MKAIIKILVVLLTIATSLLANAVATITALKGDVKIQSPNAIMEATLGAKLEEADNVITAEKSKAQIIFNDETIVTIGKNSHFSIQKYVDNVKNPEVEFNLIQGAMRTITGKIGKIAPSKFKVHTKTATIGIRGTNFTILAAKDGIREVYCTYGAISVSYKNTTRIVKQGFYVQVTPEGKVQVKKFSAKDLKALEEKNFGAKKSLIQKEEKSEELIASDDLIDTNDGSDDQLVVSDVSDDVKDAVFTSDSTAYDELKGWSIDKDSATLMTATTNLVLTEDGSSFDTAKSYVEVFDQYNLEDAKDNWYFYLQESPESFESKQNFTTAFGSVTVDPQEGSTSKNPTILNNGDYNKFTTFTESAGDYMSWGEWSIEVQYEYDDPYGGSVSETSSDALVTSKLFEGLWIAGEPTDPAVIAGLDTKQEYYGTYKAMDLANGNALDTGSASLFVDFGNDFANLIIDKSENGIVPTSYSYEMGITEANDGIHGENSTGKANGSFYGPNAESIGGNFNINDSSNDVNVKGVYQTTQQVSPY